MMFDPGKHPRGPGGRFARGFDADRLQSEWANLDRKLLPYVEQNNTHAPEANAMIARQKEINGLLHHAHKHGGMASPGLGGVHDVAIVGAGPAGLSAGIYGATEGLDTVMVDGARKAGGQIGFTSRMENTLGFPAGITGRQYADKGLEQAQRVGADVRFGHRVSKLDYDPDSQVKTLHMDDGTTIRAKSVVIAGGVQFRHLRVPNAEVPGVTYGDANELSKQTGGRDCVVVGGANSAGQGALKVAQTAHHVTMLLRHGKLGDKMSDYLVRQIRDCPNIEVKNGEIDSIHTDMTGHVDRVALKDGSALPTSGVGVYIGSEPRADWAAGVHRDATGAILTGENGRGTLETNIPGVFAAGDVRAGTMHRVIAAAGDGANAIAQVHPYLAKLNSSVEEAELPSLPVEYEDGPDEADQWMALMAELDGMTDTDVDTDGDGDLLESIAEWEIARHHKDKFGPMPGNAYPSPGRGPNGKLRNFKAMSAAKLTHTLKMLAVHGEDPHAHREAMKAAADRLGVKFETDGTIKVPQHLVLKEHLVLQEFWSDAARMRSAQVRHEKAALRDAGMSAEKGMNSPGTSGTPPPDLQPSTLGGMAAVGQHIRRLPKGQSFNFQLPEGQITATHVGLGSFHVSGGGHAVDPDARRGDRMISGAGATRREVGERIRASYEADRAHTNQIAQRAIAGGHAGVRTINDVRGASVSRTPDGAWQVHHPALQGQTFKTPHEAVRAAKSAIRVGGGRFLRTGEDVDPLHTRPQSLPMTAHLTLERKEATMGQFEKNFGDSWAEGQISSPREWIKDNVMEKVVGSTDPTAPAAPHPHPAGSFHAAVNGLMQSHAALMAPHLAAAHAVVSHPAFAHAAHMATQVVASRVDTAERDLQEAQSSGDTRRIIQARARLRVARNQLRIARQQENSKISM